MKSFFHKTKKSRAESFYDEIKSIFHHFQRAFIGANKTNFFWKKKIRLSQWPTFHLTTAWKYCFISHKAKIFDKYYVKRSFMSPILFKNKNSFKCFWKVLRYWWSTKKQKCKNRNSFQLLKLRKLCWLQLAAVVQFSKKAPNQCIKKTLPRQRKINSLTQNLFTSKHYENNFICNLGV